MQILIFRTNIKSKKKVKIIKPIFDKHSSIADWSIDLEDIENILRIEALENIKEEEIILLAQAYGFYIEALSD